MFVQRSEFIFIFIVFILFYALHIHLINSFIIIVITDTAVTVSDTSHVTARDVCITLWDTGWHFSSCRHMDIKGAQSERNDPTVLARLPRCVSLPRNARATDCLSEFVQEVTQIPPPLTFRVVSRNLRG